MGKAFGFISILIVVGIGMYIYSKQATSIAPGAGVSPKQAIDVTGVKNDLIAIAQGERRHQATTGTYASLEDLQSNGDINMKSDHRGNYSYSVDFDGGSSFRIVATNTDTSLGGPTSMWIDQTMEFHTE